MSSNGDDVESVKRYEGYTDFQSVSNQVSSSIDDAIDAYTMVNALHIEGARVRAEDAADARRHIHSAAIKLLPEIKANRESEEDSEIYDEILSRWIEEGDENGMPYLERLNEISLRDECPEWLGQLVEDIRTAGWEIGYLQAGRTVTEDNLEPADKQARQMFE